MKKFLEVAFKTVILSLVLPILCASISFASNNNLQSAKRIISVVYDDSYSMSSGGKQDHLYAKYALENVIAFMNDNDDLNVVRMSNKQNYEVFSVSGKNNKINSINKVEGYVANANDTPFAAVETAIEFLKDKKEQYGNDDNIEYWLLVLTDGDFSGSPAKASEYFNNLRFDMANVKYESVWVFIGNEIKRSFAESLQSVPGISVIYSDNSEAICDAVYDACSIIYGRPTIKQSSFVASNDNKTITINAEFPISKVMVYEQDQNVNLNNISIKGKKYSQFESIDIKKQGEPTITSKITQIAGNEVLPAGELTFEFENSLNTNENKFMIMLDFALELELGVIDNSGNFEKVNTSIFNDGDNANFAARVIDLYDKKEIDLSSYMQKVTSNYTYDGATKNMSFDGSTKQFRFSDKVKTGSNPFSALVALTGKFRLKSNIVDVYVPAGPLPISMRIDDEDNISVSKKFSDYEKVGTKEISFSGFDNDEELNLAFENIPKGIQIKANDTTVKNKKISLRVRGKQKLNLDVYRNKDFSEEDLTRIEFRANFKNNSVNDRLTNHDLYFNIIPVKRTLALNVKQVDDVDIESLDSRNAFKKNIFKVIPMIDGQNISEEELKKSKIKFTTLPKKVSSKIKYKIDEIDGQNGFYIRFEKSLFNKINPLNWINAGEKFSFDIELKSPFEETIKSQKYDINIKNNFINGLLKLIVLILALVLIIGYIKRPKFDKENHLIVVTEESKEIERRGITTRGMGLPFTREKAMAYDLNIEAGDTKSYIIVPKKYLKENMYYDNDEVPLGSDLRVYEDTPLMLKIDGRRRYYTYTSTNVDDDISVDTEEW